MKFMIGILLFSTLALANEAKPLPTREMSVIFTKEGYYPKSISVFEGERVKFYLTSTVEDPGCLIVEGHKLFMAASKGKLTEAEVHFERPGEFSFYCPSSKNNGRVVVIPKQQPKREVASEKSNDPAHWVPREY
jgi:plastocyanin